MGKDSLRHLSAASDHSPFLPGPYIREDLGFSGTWSLKWAGVELAIGKLGTGAGMQLGHVAGMTLFIRRPVFLGAA